MRVEPERGLIPRRLYCEPLQRVARNSDLHLCKETKAHACHAYSEHDCLLSCKSSDTSGSTHITIDHFCVVLRSSVSKFQGSWGYRDK